MEELNDVSVEKTDETRGVTYSQISKSSASRSVELNAGCRFYLAPDHRKVAKLTSNPRDVKQGAVKLIE